MSKKKKTKPGTIIDLGRKYVIPEIGIRDLLKILVWVGALGATAAYARTGLKVFGIEITTTSDKVSILEPKVETLEKCFRTMDGKLDLLLGVHQIEVPE